MAGRGRATNQRAAETRRQVADLLRQGWSGAQIAREIGVTPARVSQIRTSLRNGGAEAGVDAPPPLRVVPGDSPRPAGRRVPACTIDQYRGEPVPRALGELLTAALATYRDALLDGTAPWPVRMAAATRVLESVGGGGGEKRGIDLLSDQIMSLLSSDDTGTRDLLTEQIREEQAEVAERRARLAGGA